MKKILCLIDVLSAGGAERQMVGLSSLLVKKGFVVDLVTYHKNEFYKELLEGSGVYLKELDVKQSKIAKFLAVKNVVQQENYDTVIAYKDGATIIACLLKLWRRNLNVIVSERNTTQDLTLRVRIQFFLYQFVDHIVPNSYSQELFIKDHYPKLGEKIHTISNFTDTDFFSPKQMGNSQVFTIMTAARVARQKNIVNYLYAIKKIKDMLLPIKFIWYGRVEEREYEDECKRLSANLDIDDMIEFLPPSSTIVDAYRRCDVFCLPSSYEGYPNVVCEAMSCGKPILCSNVCDNPLIVEEGENGFLFDPENIDNIVEKIDKIYRLSRHEIDVMGKKSRSMAENKFSEDIFVDKYIKLINSR